MYQVLKDKYDEELEIAKSIMQKEFDQTLTEEKVGLCIFMSREYVHRHL